MGNFWDLITPPVAVLLVFEVVSTVTQMLGFGSYILKQRAEFEQRFTALDLTHRAQRQQDRAQARRETAQLRSQVATLMGVIREIKPDAELPHITDSFQAVENAEVKTLREFVRKQYSTDEFSIVMADFGVNMDEYTNESTIARMDKFIRRMARDNRLDELRDRVITDRPAAAAALDVAL